ncbi:MAG: hypothetical protein ACO3IL_04145, partial [Steroidobacteraceae bacterium]
LEWMLEVIDLAQSRRQPLEKVANLWFGLPITLKFDWIEYQIDALAAPSSLHATARRQLRSRAKDARRELVAAMLTGHAPSEEARQRWQETLTETQATGKLDHAMLSVVVSAMHTLTAGRR